MRDRRNEFLNVPWRQGYVIMTANVRRWRPEDIESAREREARTAFAYFTGLDEGRSREFVFHFETAEECRAAVERHNLELEAAKNKAAVATLEWMGYTWEGGDTWKPPADSGYLRRQKEAPAVGGNFTFTRTGRYSTYDPDREDFHSDLGGPHSSGEGDEP